MQRAMIRMQEMQLDAIYFGHYGMSNEPEEVYRQVFSWLEVYVKEARIIFTEQKGHEILAERLLSLVREHLSGQGIPDDHEVYSILQLDIDVSSMGLIDYLSK